MKETEPITRRELFARGRSVFSSGESASEQDNNQPQFSNPTLTRRRAFQALGIAGAALVAESAFPFPGITQAQGSQIETESIPGSDAEKTADVQEKQATSMPLNQTTEKQDRRSETIWQSGALGAGEAAVVSVAKKTSGLPVEKILTPTELRLLTRGEEIEGTAIGLIAVPLIEELIFRGLPSEFLAGSGKSMRWDIGIPASVISTLLGAIRFRRINANEQTKAIFSNEDPMEVLKMMVENIKLAIRPRFQKRFSPFSLLNGIFFWDKIRRGGYERAALSHVTLNATLFGLGRTIGAFSKEPPPLPEEKKDKK